MTKDILESKDIIPLPVNAKIFVKGFPGSGKTYTVQYRIKHFIEKEGLNAEYNILVLSFSRNAVREIKTRILNDDKIPSFKINVLTFDKFAARLFSETSINEKISMFGSFNQSIRKACELFEKGVLSNRKNETTHKLERWEGLSQIQHIIIDEVQDVNTNRALFSEKILSYFKKNKKDLEWGFTLLGDMDQEIFAYLNKEEEEEEEEEENIETDYSDKNEIAQISSASFLAWVKKEFTVREIELQFDIKRSTRQHRFNNLPNDLKDKIIEMHRLINTDQQLTYADLVETFDNSLIYIINRNFFEWIKQFIRDHPQDKIVFLYRGKKSGYSKRIKRKYSINLAQQLSTAFFQQNIIHQFFLGSSGLLPSWIARCMNLVRKDDQPDGKHLVSRKNFCDAWINNGLDLKTELSTEKAWQFFTYLAYGNDRSRDSFLIEDFRENVLDNFDESKLEEIGYNVSNVIISNIHKSKGREYDYVFLEKYFYGKHMDMNQEARVLFVALTRAKKGFTFYQTGKNYYPSMIDNFKPRTNAIMRQITEKSFEKFSTLNDGLGASNSLQDYIYKNVKIGDEVEIKFEESNVFRCNVYHKNTKIGFLAAKTAESIKRAMDKNSLTTRAVLKGIRIVAVTTEKVEHKDRIIKKRKDLFNNIPEYYKSLGFWIGIKIMGYGYFQ